MLEIGAQEQRCLETGHGLVVEKGLDIVATFQPVAIAELDELARKAGFKQQIADELGLKGDAEA